MNRSGEVLPHLFRRTHTDLNNLLVLCDTLDLPTGRHRLKLQGSSGGHRGLASIIQVVGSYRFMRLSVGIGRPTQSQSVVDYVLSNPPPPEAERIKASLELCAKELTRLASEDPHVVMNEINRKR